MHLRQTEVNYDAWLGDQRRRYSRALSNRGHLAPDSEHEVADAKTYLVTGAFGIGAETPKQLVKAERDANGVQLFVAAREEDQCQTLAHELRSLEAAVEYRSGDLTDPDFAPQMTFDRVSRFGRLDGLFNVAGISGRRFGNGPVQECNEESWAITINTKLTTQCRMCREALRIMLKQPVIENGHRGVILNMSSILGVDPEPEYFDTVAYATSKGGLWRGAAALLLPARRRRFVSA
jgi:NAD(P)-dependent dehydrogenase (short-subunit alcohol dehydrogenase family)